MFKNLVLSASVLVAVLGFGQVTTTRQVEAQAPEYTYLCHRTRSVSNPYTNIMINDRNIDGGHGNDHSSHTGDVFDPAVHNRQNRTWGDIIPPVAGILPDGYNWTAAGQAIYFNDCNIPSQVPSADIDFTVECSADNSSVIVEVFNYGDLAGTITINDEVVQVAADSSSSYSYEVGGRIVITIGDEDTASYDQTPVCETDENPETPVNVVGGQGGDNPTPAVLSADLPNTSGVNYAAVLSTISAATVLASLATKKLYTRFF